MNLDEVDHQHLLASVVVLMDIQKNVVHPLVLMAFEVQEQLEYNLFVLMVNLIKKKQNFFINQSDININFCCILMQLEQYRWE